MARRVETLIDREEHQGYSIFCPACKCKHTFPIAQNSPLFDGNFEAPTFNCELLEITDANDHPTRVSFWRRLWWKIRFFRVGRPQQRCHSHIREGIITFYLDSTHAMRGESVLLPPVHVANLPCIAEDVSRPSFYLKEGQRRNAEQRRNKLFEDLNR